MADYKQTSIAGEQWERFSRIVIDNPRSGAPSVNCVQERIVALDQGEIKFDSGNLSFPFNPEDQFPIINPLTNEPVGQMANGAQVYALVYSYVMNEAAKRDAALAAQVAVQAAE